MNSIQGYLKPSYMLKWKFCTGEIKPVWVYTVGGAGTLSVRQGFSPALESG